MTDQARNETLVHQYRTAIEHLRGPVTPETYEDMVAYLLGRDSLENVPALHRRLRALDLRFAEALRLAPDPWGDRLARISSRCGFARSAWWLDLLRQATAEPRVLQKAG